MVEVVPWSGWRDELCQALEEFQGREIQETAAVACWARKTVEGEVEYARVHGVRRP